MVKVAAVQAGSIAFDTPATMDKFEMLVGGAAWNDLRDHRLPVRRLKCRTDTFKFQSPTNSGQKCKIIRYISG